MSEGAPLPRSRATKLFHFQLSTRTSAFTAARRMIGDGDGTRGRGQILVSPLPENSDEQLLQRLCRGQISLLLRYYFISFREKFFSMSRNRVVSWEKNLGFSKFRGSYGGRGREVTVNVTRAEARNRNRIKRTSNVNVAS